MALFNAGWFVESLWSQTLVIHMIRTPKIPFIQSRASLPVLTLTTIAIFIGTIIPYTNFGKILGMSPMPASILFVARSYDIGVYDFGNNIKKIIYKKVW